MTTSRWTEIVVKNKLRTNQGHYLYNYYKLYNIIHAIPFTFSIFTSFRHDFSFERSKSAKLRRNIVQRPFSKNELVAVLKHQNT